MSVQYAPKLDQCYRPVRTSSAKPAGAPHRRHPRQPANGSTGLNLVPKEAVVPRESATSPGTAYGATVGPPSYSYTTFPPTMVMSTRASRISTSGIAVMSRSIRTRSANLPGSSVPLSASEKLA